MSMQPQFWLRLFAAIGAAALLTSCTTAGTDGPRRAGGGTSHWEAGAGAPEAAAFMKVKVPADATDVVGAVQVNSQEDIYLLSFVTDEEAAVRIAEDLRSEKPLRTRNQALPPAAELFGHLGLAEPQTRKSARWAGVCPPCVGDKRRSSVEWIETYVDELGAGKARVYMQAF